MGLIVTGGLDATISEPSDKLRARRGGRHGASGSGCRRQTEHVRVPLGTFASGGDAAATCEVPEAPEAASLAALA